MKKADKKKIIDWIFINHHHHAEPTCSDADEPYVNSLPLEEFIKNFREDNK